MRPLSRCHGLWGHHLSLDPVLTGPGAKVYDVEPVSPFHVPPVAALIRRAFSAWADRGVYFGALHKSDAELGDPLCRGGWFFYARAPSPGICATVTLMHSSLTLGRSTASWILNEEYGYRVVLFNAFVPLSASASHPCLLLLSLFAVDPSMAHQGLGRAIYDAVESAARQQGFGGIVLGTRAEISYVYEWYRQLGFTEVGWKKGADARPDQRRHLLLKAF